MAEDGHGFETESGNGRNPVESLQEYYEHAENAQAVEDLAEKVDGLADSMKAQYNPETELGIVKLWIEFYNDE